MFQFYEWNKSNTGYEFWKRRPGSKEPARAEHTPLRAVLQSQSATVTMFRSLKPALCDSVVGEEREIVMEELMVDFNAAYSRRLDETIRVDSCSSCTAF